MPAVTSWTWELGQRTLTLDELPALLNQHQLWRQLARQELLTQAIQDVEPAPEQLQAVQQTLLARAGIRAEDLDQYLSRAGLSQSLWDDQVRQQAQLQQFQEQQFGHRVGNRFLELKAQLDQVTYSLIRHSNFYLIQELYLRLQYQEARFEDLARQFSQGPEAQQGGRVGPMSLSKPHPILAEWLRSAQPGQLVGPLQIEDTYLIVRLDQLHSASLEQSRQRILDELCQDWLNGQIEHALRHLPSLN